MPSKKQIKIAPTIDPEIMNRILMAAMFDDTLEEAEVPDTPENRQLLKEMLIFVDEAEKNGQVVDIPN